MEGQPITCNVDDGIVVVPRLCMAAKEIIDLAIEQGVLPKIEGHYELYDRKGNVFAPTVVIDIPDAPHFYTIDIEPGRAV